MTDLTGRRLKSFFDFLTLENFYSSFTYMLIVHLSPSFSTMGHSSCLYLLFSFSVVSFVTGLESSVFSFTSMQYSPNTPGSFAKVGLSFATSVSVPSGTSDMYFLRLQYPLGFVPQGTMPSVSVCTDKFLSSGSTFVDDCSQLSSEWHVLLALDRVTLTGSPTEVTSVFSPVVYFDTYSESEQYNSVLIRVLSLASQVGVSIELCCLFLPSISSEVSISLFQRTSSGSLTVLIPSRSIQFAPRILIANAWSVLQLQFFSTSLVFSFQVADFLPIGTRIRAYLPAFSSASSEIFFTQVAPINLLQYTASWDGDTLEFVLVSELAANELVTITTDADQFVFPSELALNSQDLTAGAFSSDLMTTYIDSTIFYQSDEIFSKFEFVYSEIYIEDSLVTFKFIPNRTLFPGTEILLRLPGYQTIEHELEIDSTFFQNSIFDPSTCTINFEVLKGIDASLGNLWTVTFTGLVLPLGQYENDESLAVSVDSNEFNSIQTSQIFGVEKYLNSTIIWDNPVAKSISGFTFSFTSSVDLFGGTQIVIYLRGDFVRLMVSYDILLGGSCASYFKNESAEYDDLNNLIIVEIEYEKILPAEFLCELIIPDSARIRLPAQLSLNDGSLLLEARNFVVIRPAPITVSGPKVGLSKSMFGSITFSPLSPDTIATIVLKMEFNTALLIGSRLVVHLGGFLSPPTGPRVLIGPDAPLFTSVVWDDELQDLQFTVGSQLRDEVLVGVPAGEAVLLTIAKTERIFLPMALNENDKSIFVTVHDSGISNKQYFEFSDRVNTELEKTFLTSRIEFNSDFPLSGAVGYVRFFLTPTFMLRPGAIIVLGLPSGFVPMEAPILLHHVVNITCAVSFEKKIHIEVIENIFADFAFSIKYQFPERTLVNDPKFTVELIGAQVLPRKQFKRSEAIVPKVFQKSEIQYDPKIPLTTTSISVHLISTIALNITDSIDITLTGFVLEADNLPVAVSIDNVPINLFSASWNATTELLSLILGVGVAEESEIFIQVSEAFILPQWLALNDPKITAKVPGKIVDTPFLSSPLVGDGPYANQMFCAFMGEVGVRVLLTENDASCLLQCNWVTDPCVASQLAACGCPSITDTPSALVIRGFNLNETDTVVFSHSVNIQKSFATTKLLPNNGIEISNIRPLRPGTYVISVRHLGYLMPAGTLFVRPGCPGSKLMMESVCLDTCPFGYIPISGECRILRLPPSSVLYSKTTLRITYPNADGLGISTALESDSTFIFFKFVFLQNLNDLLYETDIDRFVITSISNNTVVEDTLVITLVITGPTFLSTNRSSQELLSLLNALIADGNSALYLNSIFSTLVPLPTAAALAAAAAPPAAFYCPQTGTYKTVCPLAITPVPTSPLEVPVWFNVGLFLGGIVGGIVFALVFLGLYRTDTSANSFQKKRMLASMNRRNLIEQDNDFSIIKIQADGGKKAKAINPRNQLSLLEPSAQSEFAKSWLDGQLVDESLYYRTRLRIDEDIDIKEDEKKEVKTDPQPVKQRRKLKTSATSVLQ